MFESVFCRHFGSNFSTLSLFGCVLAAMTMLSVFQMLQQMDRIRGQLMGLVEAYDVLHEQMKMVVSQSDRGVIVLKDITEAKILTGETFFVFLFNSVMLLLSHLFSNSLHSCV